VKIKGDFPLNYAISLNFVGGKNMQTLTKQESEYLANIRHGGGWDDVAKEADSFSQFRQWLRLTHKIKTNKPLKSKNKGTFSV